jgi:hypothetical protein
MEDPYEVAIDPATAVAIDPAMAEAVACCYLRTLRVSMPTVLASVTHPATTP